MPTAVVSWTSGSPSTQFITYADLVSQDQAGNTSSVYLYVQAINRGNTSSFSGNAGSQVFVFAGQSTGHSGTLPSGYATGQQRWMDGPWGVTVPMDGNGNRNPDPTTQNIAGWFSNSATALGPGYPRIPKPPSVPGTPVASNILPTSLQLDWTASVDNAGAAIDAYLVRRWTGASMTGSYVDVEDANVLEFVDTGLVPGTQYTYGIYAHNGSAGGYSVVSAPLTVSTLAPMHIKEGGVYKYAVPYVKVSGAYVLVIPYIKTGGTYDQTG